MIKWAVKHYLIGKINSLLVTYKSDVDGVTNTLTLWIGRLERILSCLRATLAKLDDGRIDETEIDQAVADVEEVIKGW